MRDLDIQFIRHQEHSQKDQIEMMQRHRQEIDSITKTAKGYKDKLKVQDKEIKILRRIQAESDAQSMKIDSLSSMQEILNQERLNYEQALKIKDRENESLKAENEQLRRDVQNSFRSNMEQRVFKQSFHFNSSNNAIGSQMPTCAAGTIPQLQLAQDEELSSGRNQKSSNERKMLEMQDKIRYLEVKLMETEKRSKKEYSKEIKR